MAQAKTLSVGGIGYEVIDDTARSNAQTALNNAEYNRQGQIGKYGGQNIATILAGEVASGALNDSNSWSWQDIGKVFSLSEMEVYGCPVWGTKGYSVGFDCQWDLFRDTAHRINGNRDNWWLRSVVGGSSSNVCYVSRDGTANYSSAAYVWVRPRPGFLDG